MKRSIFTPSTELRERESQQRDDRGPGYRGNKNLPANTGEHVPEKENTHLWIMNLPPSTTISTLLEKIRGVGRVRSTVIHPANKEHKTSSASVSFFTREDAEILYNRAQSYNWNVGDRFPHVYWNRNKVAPEANAWDLSRVLLIAGPPDYVNRRDLDRYFSGRFIYDLDEVVDHGLVEGPAGPIVRLEYRFGSWRSQALFGMLALSRELWEELKVEYGEDPCAV
ncbi:hypothetical protein F5B20DRAFT_571585 [Whalleya microplaca]|nr:hypothetical protein F5B20DRAFT_571585 [Whalleya microplaca]